MPMKFSIAKLDEVAEPLRTLYRAEGDKFVLDVEGAVEKTRLDEFRTTNIQLQQQLDKLKDIDPEKYKELRKLQQKIEEKQLIDAGEVDKAVNLRVASMKEELESKLNEATTGLSKANAQLATLLIDNSVKTAAAKNGILPTALDDIVFRARGTFVLENGVPIPKSGEQVVYGKDGKTPMTPDEWVIGLKKTAPHLFQGSRGSGAQGGDAFGTVDVSKLSAIDKINLGMQQSGMLPKLPTEP